MKKIFFMTLMTMGFFCTSYAQNDGHGSQGERAIERCIEREVVRMGPLGGNKGSVGGDLVRGAAERNCTLHEATDKDGFEREYGKPSPEKSSTPAKSEYKGAGSDDRQRGGGNRW